MLEKADSFFALIARACGVLAGIAMILMLFNVFYDVIMRYAFNDVSIGMQELEWHLFAVVFLLGTPYAMQRDGHVRVDIFYDQWTEHRKAWVNLIGSLVFVLPFVVLVAFYGVGFTSDSFQMNEGSGDPGGLPFRWLIKGLIPLSFILMALAGCGMVTHAVLVLQGKRHYGEEPKDMLT